MEKGEPEVFLSTRYDGVVDMSGVSRQNAAGDGEWGICPCLFHDFWLVRRGQ